MLYLGIGLMEVLLVLVSIIKYKLNCISINLYPSFRLSISIYYYINIGYVSILTYPINYNVIFFIFKYIVLIVFH